MNEDWSGWSELPWKELEARVTETLSLELAAQSVDALKDIFWQRAIVSLRKASRDELLLEAIGLSSLKSRASRNGRSELAFFFDVVGRGVATAAACCDKTAIDSTLRSYQKYGIRMLEFIASHGDTSVVERKRIREHLGIESKNDSYLSHMLNAFEKCGIIRRLPSSNGSGMRVALDVEGKELVKAKLRPDWLPVLVELIESNANYRTTEDIKDLLIRSGFSSAQAASEIASAFSTARFNSQHVPTTKMPQFPVNQYLHPRSKAMRNASIESNLSNFDDDAFEPSRFAIKSETRNTGSKVRIR